jgi:hypothetical protein
VKLAVVDVPKVTELPDAPEALKTLTEINGACVNLLAGNVIVAFPVTLTLPVAIAKGKIPAPEPPGMRNSNLSAKACD